MRTRKREQLLTRQCRKKKSRHRPFAPILQEGEQPFAMFVETFYD